MWSIGNYVCGEWQLCVWNVAPLFVWRRVATQLCVYGEWQLIFLKSPILVLFGANLINIGAIPGITEAKNMVIR